MAGGTAVASEPRMLAHDPGRGHPERADRLRILLDHVDDTRGLVRLPARPATPDELALVHTGAHVERVASTAGRPAPGSTPAPARPPARYKPPRSAAGGFPSAGRRI